MVDIHEDREKKQFENSSQKVGKYAGSKWLTHNAKNHIDNQSQCL